ncbi:HET-domain-containing protein [Amniculicola lignicola CBS 123094]|uniref:HET-domain-containing protein n=1 Tax=Amniculicola lignicola CBS 123094 TaxID=1392246 RepID=A0A6A5WKI3_9PLEO|nr:HET-domain-containing protein [Amniculicola lignicola CBS 123094]
MGWPHAAALLCPDGLWVDHWTANGHGKTISPVTDFVASANNGCPACTMLLHVIEEISPGWTTRDSSGAYFIRLEHSYASSLRVSLVGELPSSSAVTKAIHFGKKVVRGFTRDHKAGREKHNINTLRPHLHQLDNEASTTFALLCTQTDQEAIPLKSEAGSIAAWHLSSYDLGAYGKAPRPVLTLREWFHSTFHVAQCSASTIAFERVKRWLKHCQENDTVCQSSHQSFVPRRLIKIESRNDRIRLSLHESKHPVDYVCLSYRWGAPASEIITTRQSNVDAFRNHIPLQQLPATIQDAVTVCHGIGLSYLWVDSLCIVQDDSADWEREAPQMLDIYANSHLTIYATAARSCKEKFLGPQQFGNPHWQRAVQAEIPVGLELPGSGLAVRMVDDNERKGDLADLSKQFQTPLPGLSELMAHYSMSGEPGNVLSRRAWCLQEELLPNRRLYFNGCQLRWECGKRHISEANYRKPNPGMFEPRPPYGWKCLTGYAGKVGMGSKALREAVNTAHFGDDLEYNTLKEWMRIVQDYSGRHLSFQSDKLVAVAGLAQLIGQATQAQSGKADTYLAGLWESTLIAGLCWKAGPWEFAMRQDEYRAPTWSWAAMDGPINFVLWEEVVPWKYPPTFIPEARLIASEVQPISQSNPFGQLQSGYIQLVGPLIPVEVMTTPDGRKGQKESKVRAKNLYSYKVFLDYEAGRRVANTCESYDCWMKRACSRGCCDWKGDRSLEGSQFFCLQLFTWECRSSEISDSRLYYNGIEPVTFFLVLQRGQNGEYTRIGVGQALARKDIEWPRIGDGTQEPKRFQCPLFAEAQETCIRIN